MKRIFTIIFVLFIGLCNNIYAQELKALKIGDKVPDVVLAKMLNYKSATANLSEFGGKPLIIDFWFIGCASCIELMPHLDSLQKEYAGKLQILLATRDSKERVADFFKRSKYVENIKFAQAVNDTVLHQLFPARIMPHQIWIDKNGVVKAITDGRTATKENIEKFMAGKEIDFVPKINEQLDPSVAMSVQPMMLYDFDGSKEKIRKNSYLSDFRKGFTSMSGRFVIDTPNQILRYKAINTHFLQLYDDAYLGEPGFSHIPSRFIREDNGRTLPFKINPKDYSQYYCYDLICRFTDGSDKGLAATVSKNMINDLDRTFNLKSHIEKRKVWCWILKEYGANKIYQKSVGKGMGYNENKQLNVGKKLIIQNISALFFIMNLSSIKKT